MSTPYFVLVQDHDGLWTGYRGTQAVFLFRTKEEALAAYGPWIYEIIEGGRSA